MKQLVLPLTAAVLATGCASQPDAPKPTPVSAPMVTHKTDVHLKMNTTTEKGEKLSVEHSILVDASTVARPEKKAVSTASFGEAWWGDKPGNYNEAGIEKSTLSQNIDMGIKNARAEGLDGNGVIVGVVDTGISSSEIEASRITITTGVGIDGSIHGGGVANLIAGSKNGIAPNAKLIDARHNKDSRIINRSITTAAETADIINYSGNSFLEADGSKDAIFNAKNILPVYQNAIKKQGALIVQSIGNDGRARPNAHAHTVEMDPELKKGLVLVAGANSTKDRTLASKNGEVWSNACGDYAEICMTAPAHYTERHSSTGYMLRGGTSFAAPRVSGTAALIKQKYPWASNDVLRTTLLTTADPMGDKSKYGWGMLNIGKAINGPAQLAFGELETNVTPGVYSFSNNISGSGSLLKTGKGTLNLDGAGTFTGGIKVQGGVLNINRSYTGTTSVSNKATVGGEGIARTITSKGGVVDFQDGLAVIDLNLDQGSTTKIRLGRTAKVAGTANLAGDLHVGSIDKSLTTVPEKVESAITIGNRNGTFNSVSSSVMYTPKLTYTAKGVDVALTRKNASEVKSTLNSGVSEVVMNSVASGAQRVDAAVSGNQSEDLVALHAETDAKTVLNSLYSMGDSLYGNSLDATKLQVSAFHNDVLDASLSAVQESRYGKNNGISVSAFGGYGENSWVPSSDAKGSVSQNNYGVGASWVKNDIVVSGVASKHTGKWSESFNGVSMGSADADVVGAQLSAAKNFGDIVWGASVAGYNIKTDVNRTIDTIATATAVNGEQTNRLLQVGVVADKPIANPYLDISVKGGLKTNFIRQGALNEEGFSSLGLSKSSESYRELIGSLGGSIGKSFDGGLLDHVKLGLGIEHNFSDKASSSGSWDVAKTRYNADASIGVKLGKNITGSLNMSHTHTDVYKDTVGTAGIKVTF